MGKIEGIMDAFAEDNASNRPRKIDPIKSTGALVGAWLGQNKEYHARRKSVSQVFFRRGAI